MLKEFFYRVYDTYRTGLRLFYNVHQAIIKNMKTLTTNLMRY
jgi:hypothetical protein